MYMLHQNSSFMGCKKRNLTICQKNRDLIPDVWNQKRRTSVRHYEKIFKITWCLNYCRGNPCGCPFSVVSHFIGRPQGSPLRFLIFIKILKRFLTGKQTVVNSKLFFAFIAFIIYSELEIRKGKATLKQESLLENDIIQKLFDDFDTIEEYQVAKGNFKWSEITKKQHDILTELCFPDLKN